MRNKPAFSLAEVLITLVIIGVVAALTLPNIIYSYKKAEIETKLQRFYSMMNQAITLSELDNNDKTTWNIVNTECNLSPDGEECLTKFFNSYLKKYMKFNHTEYQNNGLCVFLNDGSVFKMRYYGFDYYYYINSKELDTSKAIRGKDYFMFGFYPTAITLGDGGTEYSKKNYLGKGVEPFVKSEWDGTLEYLYKEKNYTKIIQLNGWKIPANYPIKL